MLLIHIHRQSPSGRPAAPGRAKNGGEEPCAGPGVVSVTSFTMSHNIVQVVDGDQLPVSVGQEPVLRPGDSRDLDPELDGGREVACTLGPGEASLHGWRTVHSSRPNTSARPRLGLAIRYMCADSVRQQQPVVR